MKVPNLMGLDRPSAIAELAKRGFRARVRRERSLHPEDIVYAQRPGPGERRRRGWTVTFTVAYYTPPEEPPPPPAPPASTLERLVGLDYAEAASRLQDLGIVANSYPAHSGKRVAYVIAQSPRPGTRVPRGSRIRITVSTGRAALGLNAVPNAVGLRELAAHERCRDAHFLCRTVVVPAAGGEPGRVLRQTPAAGQAARALSQMTLYVGE